jgi:hypothetical protein
VIAPFQTYNVDIVPAFRFISGPYTGQYLVADTTDGGSWRNSNPVAEYNWLQQTDAATAGKVRHLIKMLKAWKRECKVEIKSISLEVPANVFVTQWEYHDKTIFYYDWMTRDFFAFSLNYVNGWVQPAGITERILLGDYWATKCRSAYTRALRGCEYEYADKGFAASSEWQRSSARNSNWIGCRAHSWRASARNQRTCQEPTRARTTRSLRTLSRKCSMIARSDGGA